MKDKIERLIEDGFSIEEIHKAVHGYIDNKVIRCDGCRRRLGDLEDGLLIIKCRCGEINKLI